MVLWDELNEKKKALVTSIKPSLKFFLMWHWIVRFRKFGGRPAHYPHPKNEQQYSLQQVKI